MESSVYLFPTYQLEQFVIVKILFIIPGAGDSFYCGNCFRDNLQASALRKAGHEVVVMPLYLPLRHSSFQADTPLFFPATSYYVAQKFFGKRKMPSWLERLTNSDTLLHIASSLSGTTSAEGMGQMTLSMITGGDAAFSEYVKPLIDWIGSRERPDIIHLSSTLLLGIAKMIKERFAIPVVCSVQDEEVWIDSLSKEDASEAWLGIKENLQSIDRFIATSRFYKHKLQRYMPEVTNIDVVYPGIDREKYVSDAYPSDPTIGFFYRMNQENGLDILAEAFILLKKRGTIPNLKLKIGGGYTGKDKRFLKKIQAILKPYMPDVEICHSYDPDEHAAFYKTITLLSVPITFEESVGLYLCEAFAAGRPVVEPLSGSFPEIIDNAGITYTPNTSLHLADALECLLKDESLLLACRHNARRLSDIRYNDSICATALLTIYEGVMH